MNRCAECMYSIVSLEYGIPCDVGNTETGDRASIDACPFCGSPRISPQTGGHARCGCCCTEYTCGTKLIVNYGYSRFAAINYMSDLCSDLHRDIVENTI